MNMKNIFCCLLPGLLFGACANKVYEETGDSVIVKVQQEVTGGPRLVRLQVMGDKLIHVSATADSKFADPQSLIVVPQEKQIPFAVMQNGDWCWRSAAPREGGEDHRAMFARLSGRLLELHQFLLQSPTEVTFTAAQWEEHTSRFSSHLSEVVNERDDSPGAIVLRHGLMASRIAGVLTALRKGECAWAMPQYVCSDEDFHTAMLMTDVLLEHSLLLSTSVRKSESKSGPLKPYFRLRPVLQTFSGTFTYKDAMDRAVEMGIPVTTFKRLFRKTIELKIIDKEGDMYIRTRRGWRETDA